MPLVTESNLKLFFQVQSQEKSDPILHKLNTLNKEVTSIHKEIIVLEQVLTWIDSIVTICQSSHAQEKQERIEKYKNQFINDYIEQHKRAFLQSSGTSLKLLQLYKYYNLTVPLTDSIRKQICQNFITDCGSLIYSSINSKHYDCQRIINQLIDKYLAINSSNEEKELVSWLLEKYFRILAETVFHLPIENEGRLYSIKNEIETQLSEYKKRKQQLLEQMESITRSHPEYSYDLFIDQFFKPKK